MKWTMNFLSMRWLSAAAAVSCAVLMATALYFQYVKGLEPCPLCTLQRVTVIVLGVVFFAAALHDPRGWGRRVYGVVTALFAAIGLGVAARHVWLQQLPEAELPGCGPGLDYMLEVFSMSRTLKLVLTGSGECGEILWTFLSLSIPGWMLVWFGIYFVLGLAFALRPATR